MFTLKSWIWSFWVSNGLNLLIMHWRRKWQPTPVFLPGESRGQESLVDCRLWGRTESDTTQCLHFHYSLSRFGEGNGNPLQCSSLENPRDRGAWWASVSGVAQSRTRLKRRSSSSSSSIFEIEKSQASNFVLFLNCFGYPGSLYFHKNVRSSSSISAKMLWLCWICRSICCHVNNTKFVIYQYMMPFHLLRSSLMSIENPSVLYYCSFFKILLASMINCFLTLLI